MLEVGWDRKLLEKSAKKGQSRMRADKESDPRQLTRTTTRTSHGFAKGDDIVCINLLTKHIKRVQHFGPSKNKHTRLRAFSHLITDVSFELESLLLIRFLQEGTIRTSLIRKIGFIRLPVTGLVPGDDRVSLTHDLGRMTPEQTAAERMTG